MAVTTRRGKKDGTPTKIPLSSLVQGKEPKLSRVAQPGDYDLSKLFGPNLLTAVTHPPQPTGKVLQNTELILLYFTASYSNKKDDNKKKMNAQSVNTALLEFYNTAAKDHYVEIILISSDSIVEEFEEFYATMPWLAIPSDTGAATIKAYLATTLSVRRQPSLIVIDAKTGEYVPATDAKDEIITAAAAPQQQRRENIVAVINRWKNLPRQPLSAAGQSQNPVVRFFMFLVKNPVLLFGIMSLIRLFRQKMLPELVKYFDNNHSSASSLSSSIMTEINNDETGSDTEF